MFEFDAVAKIEEALRAAEREGNLERVAVDPMNAWNFLEHVGSMIASGALSGASAIAWGTRSIASRRPADPSSSKIALEWPPRPNVPST